MHSNLIIAIVLRRNHSLRCIGADHKRGPRKQARLFDEGGRSRQFDRRLPGEFASRRLTVSPAIGGLSTLVTKISNAIGCCLSSSATRASNICPACSGSRDLATGQGAAALTGSFGHRAGRCRDRARPPELIDSVHGRDHRLRKMSLLHRAGCVATVRQFRMRGLATGRLRAKRGLLQRRDHVVPGDHARECAMPADLAKAMKPMLAYTRAIADQCRGRAQTNQIGARRHQLGRACPYAPCHRGCGVSTACLCRCEAEKRRKRQPVVGNLRLYQQPGAPGNTSDSLTAPRRPW